MKKTLTFVAVLLIGTGSMMADEVNVGDVTIPQGGQATVSISLTNPDKVYTAGQMLMVLPEGVTAVLKENGDPTTAKGERINGTSHTVGASHLEDGTDQFTIFSISSEDIPGSEGTLFSITLTADAGLAAGTSLEGRLTNIELTTTDGIPAPFNNQTFNITIGEPADTHVLLDENATTPLSNVSPANVLLKRTINAGEWSTIVLPFTATGEQVKQAWGEDVQLASFTGWDSEEDADGAIVAINVMFTSANAADGIAAGTPMLIQVSQATETATFDGVTIEPEEEPVVQVGMKASERGYFYGTYTKTTVPEENMFLSGNKFWYSTGNTAIKGYRGYFGLHDVLDAYYDGSEVKVNIFVDDDATGIEETLSNSPLKGEDIYNLAGQRVGKNFKGVVIENGKKILK